MDQQKTVKFVNKLWDESIVPTLMEYIRIPNKSPLFDSEWQQHGYMEAAIQLIAEWCQDNAAKKMQLEILRLENRTPLLMIEILGTTEETVLLYGHLDKQPEMTGWDEDLSPWNPVLKKDRLYGRGGADDGYAVFAALTAIKALQDQNIPHPRCVILIEASEESGSCDLPFYIEAFSQKLGQPRLVICLDSGCGNYEQLWVSTSLRGMMGGVLHINVLKEGVHSGNGSGIVPSPFLILRQLLNKIEAESTGEIILDELFVEIPEKRLEQAKLTAQLLGKEIYNSYPFCQGALPLVADVTEQILNRTWRPALSIIGADGIPQSANAGNVTLPAIAVKLSIRLPPTSDAKIAAQVVKNTLESNPPYNAKIVFDIHEAASGWNAPTESPWLHQAIDSASKKHFGAQAMYMGEGGSIPFMGMLGKKFPDAQFLITGLLGPESNAHGPNEFLHISAAKKLTCCVAEVIAEFATEVHHS